MDLDELVAIDVHTHVHKSVRDDPPRDAFFRRAGVHEQTKPAADVAVKGASAAAGGFTAKLTNPPAASRRPPFYKRGWSRGLRPSAISSFSPHPSAFPDP